MTEKSQFRDVLVKCLILFIFATLYCLGGAEFGPGKWLRRFVAPFFLTGGLFWFSRDWKSFISLPFVMIGTSLGYGSDYFWVKILKRTYCGLILGAGSASGDWLNKRFLIAAAQTIIATTGMVLLGVFNPLPDARVEEFCIGIIIGFLPLMSARRKTI